MKQTKKAVLALCLVVMMLFSMSTAAFAVPVTAESPVVNITLKEGNYKNWIDRLDLTGAEYAREFYNWLKNTDALIDPYAAGEIFAGEGIYGHEVATVSGTDYINYTGNKEIDTAEAKKLVGKKLNLFEKETYAYIDAAYSAFCRDYPEYFWLNDRISITAVYSFKYDASGKVNYEMTTYLITKTDNYDIRAEEYRSAELIASAIEQREDAVRDIVASAPDTPYEAVKYFNEWLTSHNSYNSNATTAGKDAHECISALAGKTDANGPVCEGYAKAMKVLCDAAGIDCVLVDGVGINAAGNSEAHMWNYVKMDDGNWYAVDVTWNDPATGSSAAVSGAENTDYLLVGSNTVVNDNGITFGATHTVRNMVTTNGTAFINGPVLAVEAYVYGGEEEKPCLHEETEIRGAKEATATQNGYTGDTWCKVCHEQIATGRVIPATGGSSEKIETTPMYRMYNPNSGEHFYTGSIVERDNLIAAGWHYEGIGWNAPTKTGQNVHRLFNPNNGDHHYTMSLEERDNLVNVGWQYEGVCWNSAGSENLPQYRLYNPNADCGSHHYTGSIEEREMLVSVGWKYEGIGWFGMLQ